MFHVVDYKDVAVGEQASIAFSHRLFSECVKWLAENQTEEDLRACRYVLDGDESSWQRKFG